jgi:hypothetical protein
MKLTKLTTSALAVALVTAGMAHAQPFNFLNGPGAREDTVAVSPPPFNVFLNPPAESGLVYAYPVTVHHHHVHHHYYY